MRDPRFRLLLAALAATSALASGAAPPALSIDARASDLADEAETICAAAHSGACAVTGTDRAQRLQISSVAVSASPSKPVPVRQAECAPENEGAIAAGRPLARWCVAHSTSTSLV